MFDYLMKPFTQVRLHIHTQTKTYTYTQTPARRANATKQETKQASRERASPETSTDFCEANIYTSFFSFLFRGKSPREVE